MFPKREKSVPAVRKLPPRFHFAFKMHNFSPVPVLSNAEMKVLNVYFLMQKSLVLYDQAVLAQDSHFFFLKLCTDQAALYTGFDLNCANLVSFYVTFLSFIVSHCTGKVFLRDFLTSWALKFIQDPLQFLCLRGFCHSQATNLHRIRTETCRI